MADQKTPEELAADAEAKAKAKAEADAAKAAKVKAAPAEDTITLRCEGAPWSGTLRIGVEEFVVTDGVVEVPARALQGAHQAGFRP
jgi:hypothetical protein